ncbi:MAG: PilZ domain-containing protein [Spirochaetota bacterium]
MPKFATFIELEFILKEVMRAASPVIVHGSGKSLSAVIHNFGKDFVSLDYKESDIGAAEFKSWEDVSIYLANHDQRSTFKAKVNKIEAGRLVLGLPDKILKTPQRNAVRVPPPRNVSLSFFLQEEVVSIDCPESREYTEIDLPVLREGFDVSSMNSFLASFKEKASEMVVRNGIVMFNKGRKPTSVEEEILCHYGRAILFASTMSTLPVVDPYSDGRIVTQSMVDDYERSLVHLQGSRFETSRLEKALSGIIAEAWCPILYYQYVVGYVYLMNDQSKPVSLDFRAIDFSWEFARILAYKLKDSNYFKADPNMKPDPFKPGVIDFSATGCLFFLPKTGFKVKLKISAIIDLCIDTGHSELLVKGRVARRYDDKENEYYGICFVSAEDEDLSILKAALYSTGSTRFACSETEF